MTNWILWITASEGRTYCIVKGTKEPSTVMFAHYLFAITNAPLCLELDLLVL